MDFTPEYFLLSVTRFNVYISELKLSCDSDSSQQKIYVLKCQGIIQTAILVPPSPCHECFVLVASGNLLWKVLLPGKRQDGVSIGQSQTKMRKRDEVSTSHDHIFAELLGQDLGNTSSFQPEESTQKNTFSLLLKREHLLYSFSSRILDITARDETLVVLIEEQGMAHIRVYCFKKRSIQDGMSCTQNFSTGIESSIFYHAKPLSLVVEELASHSGAAGRAECHTQTVGLPRKLFTSLFGKEAACLKSPVVLLCGTNGCVYFYCIKSLISDERRLEVLCDTGSKVVCISRMELESQPQDGANSDVISLLESALEGGKVAEGSERSLSTPSLVIVGESGECCVFLHGDVSSEPFMFSLPHSTHSCISRGSHLFYATENGMEVCEISLTRQANHVFGVTVSTKFAFERVGIMHLVAVSWDRDSNDHKVVAVSNELKVVHLPTSQDRQADSALPSNNSGRSIETILKDIPSYPEDLKTEQLHVDACLLQLNLFASLIEQKSVSQSGVRKAEETVVSCECSISPIPNGYSHIMNLRVILKNNIAVSFTDDWTVDVCMYQQADSESNVIRHNAFLLSKGLATKSSLEFCLPVPDLTTSKLNSYVVSVSLILNLNQSFTLPKEMPHPVQRALSVEIHKQSFDALDFMHVTSDTNPAVSLGKSTRLSCASQLTSQLLAVAEMRNCGRGKEKVERPWHAPTFTLSLGVSEAMSKKFKVHTPPDLIRLLLTRGSGGAIPAQANMSSQVQLKTPDGEVPVSLAVSTVSEVERRSDGVEPGPKAVIYTVTLRSADITLLMATRASLKARLEKQKLMVESGNDHRVSLSRAKLNRQLQRCEKLADSLQAIQRKFTFADYESCSTEDASILCDLFDKFELIF